MSETLQEKMARLAEADKNNTATGASSKNTPTPPDSTPQVKEPKEVQKVRAETETTDKVFHVFYSTISACRVVTDIGHGISFIKGKYITDNEADIEYLQGILAEGSKTLSVLAGKETQTESDLDPMKVLKEQHYQEFLAEQAEVARKKAAGIPLSTSESEVQPLTPGSSNDIADMAEGNQ